jgi:hypothetical protein
VRSARVTILALACAVGPGTARAGCNPVAYYGTYSVGTKAGGASVSLGERLTELKGLGANLVVATGDGTAILDLLPPGLLAVPGCGLMKREDWQRDGRWDETQARARLAALAARFARHPRVFGICLTHEVTEYASHARRRWMYRLAKEYFPDKPVIHYYAQLWDRSNPERRKVWGYGLDHEIETDVLFVSLQAVHDGHFSLERARRLKEVLSYAARTPAIPVWAQTSINADHKYVTGRDSMVAVWGERGENMKRWTDAVFQARHTDDGEPPLRLSGFFWRSLGRFPYDLGYPDFAAQRAEMAAIADGLCARP